ncbi:hypothetical protein ACJ73_09064, partial [Blastomyces percursus]
MDPGPHEEKLKASSAEPNGISVPGHTDYPDMPLLSTMSIEALQSIEQREFMGLVDRLRRAGLSSILQLPQIVVCGDQSSGKSSVLEAVTEIPFPRKENLCTRFATQIIMRPGLESTICCKIIPDSSRTEDEQLQLRSFSRSIEDFHELPSLIDDATAAMGLDESKAFARDVLSVEICGPGRPQLTLVDLPGLIHSANKSQSDDDVELIKSLVEDYIAEERTIILAVVSAKNDYANQVILKNCRKFDPKGTRTFGIITKPDYLRSGSDNERAWLDLAQNRDIFFELGWHLLKNRADDEHQLSFAERNLSEHRFLNSGSYKSLPQHMKGIDSLRERLSQLLFQHLKRELPILKDELDGMARTTRMELSSIGASRATLTEQRVYLAEFFSSAYNIVAMSMTGNYEGSFFGNIDINAPINKKGNSRRLRAVVQHLNIKFAERMHRHGHKYYIQEEDTDETPEPQEKSAPFPLSRKEAVTRVVQILKRSRGREIPGTFNPMLISQLFWEQSEGWGNIARGHVEAVAAACKTFLLDVLDHVAAPELKTRLLSMTVLPALAAALNAALKELQSIESDKQRHPITYNHYFTDTLQKAQQERFSGKLKKMTPEATVTVDQKTWVGRSGYEKRSYIDPDLLHEMLDKDIQRDMDNFSAEQALDAHDAYYK